MWRSKAAARGTCRTVPADLQVLPDTTAAQCGDAEASDEEEECEAADAGSASHGRLQEMGIMRVGSGKSLAAEQQDLPPLAEQIKSSREQLHRARVTIEACIFVKCTSEASVRAAFVALTDVDAKLLGKEERSAYSALAARFVEYCRAIY